MISKRGYQIYSKELMDDMRGDYRECTLTESLHGDLPTMTMKFTYSESKGIYEDLDNITVTIKSSRVGEPYQVTAKGHVYNITTDQMHVTYHILLCDKNFIKDNRVRYFGKSLESTVRSLYKGNITSDIKSNINSHTFNQSNQTDYNYLKEILPSYNQNVLWGFSCEGLLIKRVNGEVKFPHYDHKFSGTPTSPISKTESKHILLPSPKVHRFTYFSSSVYDKQIKYTELGDEDYEVNRQVNFKYMQTPSNQLDIPYGEFPPYEIGDSVYLSKNLNQYKYTAVTRNIIMNESLNVIMTYGSW